MRIPPERTICTGDIAAYCADPAATIDLIRGSGIHAVTGNCDEQLGAGASDCGCGFAPGSACDRAPAAVDGIIDGHCGLPFINIVRGKLWHNAGVIGMPANDGTPRVWYILLRPSRHDLQIRLTTPKRFAPAFGQAATCCQRPKRGSSVGRRDTHSPPIRPRLAL